MRHNARTIVMLAGATAAALACAKVAADTPAVRLGATQRFETGTATTVALSPGGRRAAAWVSAPGGGSDGRLYVAAADPGRALGEPAELRDPLGPIQPHGEAPPKLAFAEDGA